MVTYLSKSNKAEINEVMKLNHDLVKLGDTIIEHLGGEFKMSIIDPAQRVICVPPMNTEFTKTRCVVGRGNYSEADYALSVLNIPHYIYKNGKIFKTIRVEKIPGKDSWQEYAYVYYEEEGQFLNPLRQDIEML